MTDSSETTMRLAVFELGRLPEEIDDDYPDYPAMIAQWLSPTLPEASFSGVSPVRGEPLPEPGAFDGYIYSGSRHGVYDDLAWIAPLEEFIRAVAGSNIPQFGICFGHQIMAEALGGKAVKSERGWGCGVHTYAMRLDDGEAREVPVMVLHQDQVVAVPDAAEVIGGNEFCPIGAVRYPQAGLTVQFHPEFSRAYMVDLLDLRGGKTIPTDRASAARDSLETPPDALLIAEWTARFFRERLGTGLVDHISHAPPLSQEGG